MKIEEGHQQQPFELGDPWARDPSLRHVLHRLFSIPTSQLALTADSASSSSGSTPLTPEQLDAHLARFSRAVKSGAAPWAEADKCHDPRLVNYDNWGRRVDRIETCEGWRQIEKWSVQQGIIGEAYPPFGQERFLGKKEYDSAGGRVALDGYARMYTFARTYLFSPYSRVNVCPTSMQDGAVRVLELYGTPKQRETYIPRLLSRHHPDVWVAGQWMTERPGGSDVAQTETRATRMENLVAPHAQNPTTAERGGQGGEPGDLYLIDGFKWFSSCPDGNMSLALARTSSDTSAGSSGLSLFLIPLRRSGRPPIPAHLQHLLQDGVTNPHNDFNGIKVHRLKHKLGTELVPTAELELDGRSCVGELIGQEGRGVFYIASVLNLTRLYSASGSASAIGFALNIATDWSRRRRVEATKAAPQGTLLSELPMHVERLTRVSVTHKAVLQLVFGTIRLLSLSEAGKLRASPSKGAEEELRLRLLTPVSKAFAATRGTECYVQCIEALGGQGYMVENLLADVLKSATVERIWEGTPSVLAHDVKRVLEKTKGAALAVWLRTAAQELKAAALQLASASASASASTDKHGASVPLIGQALGRALQAAQSAFLEPKTYALTPLVYSGRACRALLELIGITQSGIGLLQQAAWSHSFAMGARALVQGLETGSARADLEVARRWVLGAEGGLQEALRELDEVRQLVLAQGSRRTEELNRAIVYQGRDETVAQQVEQELGSSVRSSGMSSNAIAQSTQISAKSNL